MANQTHIVSFDDARRRRLSHAPDASRSSSRRSGVSGDSGTLFADDDFYASLGSSDGFDASDSPASSRRGEPSRAAARSFDPFAPRTSERVVERYEEDLPAEEDDDQPSDGEDSRKKGPLADMMEKARRTKRAKAKERAGKKFASQYGGDPSSAAAASAGPRAAVYKAEMGSQHKRAARMQGEGASRAAGQAPGPREGSARESGLPSFVSSKPFIALCGVAVCLVFCCAFLYTPARQYYQEMRERDRLALEYEAVQQRNGNLEDSVAYLSTDEGVEDQAREEFGWVKEGERAVSVSGVEVEEESSFTANVLSSDIEPPDTWYSGILDPLFGVE